MSRVSRRRSTASGLPARFARILFLELGAIADGSRAFDGTGDEFIGSSSGMGEGEAFLLREEPAVDTRGERAVSDMILSWVWQQCETYLILRERDECAHGNEEEWAVQLDCSLLLVAGIKWRCFGWSKDGDIARCTF